MRQSALDEFMGKVKHKPKSWMSIYRCPICGKTFSTRKGLCIHMSNSKDHKDNPPLVYPNEGIRVATNGGIIELRVKMKKELWEALVKRAQEENVDLTEFIFEILVNTSAYGRNYQLWNSEKEQKPKITYII